MSEQNVEYRDLPREKKLEVLGTLAKIAIDIIKRHPDVRVPDVESIINHHPYGEFAWLAIQHAIKKKQIIANYTGNCTTLRIPEEEK